MCIRDSPYVTSSCNHREIDDQFRAVRIPNTIPNLTMPPDSDFSMSAGDFEESFREEHHSAAWDAVLCSFFLDTAHNIFDYLRTIYRLLKPGGRLISLGPLLWHYADMPGEMSIELSWEELQQALEGVGFQILVEETDRECKYTSDDRSMQYTVFRCVLFVAQKPFEQFEHEH
eukprot:TRINITY_DN28721_c0_g1_i1.p1 TRINITY_DN28721_c0_g1~~TRINITY_DN28721_c0_g1_i1.p1  ORF type:complete len:173 (-),score=45.31 TRINITY_DN28721_c0_g1_i1:376-894(-)